MTIRGIIYYPGASNPLHAVNDWAKVRSMIRTLRAGKSLPVIYIDGPLHGSNWLSGTHRVAASEIRARLDGTDPYTDLNIFDVSDWLAELTPSQLERFCEMENEDRCNLFDQSNNAEDFSALLMVSATNDGAEEI